MSVKYIGNDVKISTLSSHVLGSSVVFAATQIQPAAKQNLVFELLQAVARLDDRLSLSTDPAEFNLRKDSLGAPVLMLADRQGPSLSFSHGRQKLWAAMCIGERMGIDVAYPEEFAGDYPFARVFKPEELDRARALCTNNTARGAALLWSVKEAAVKAIGTGFNRLEPVEVRVGTPIHLNRGYLFEVFADRPIPAWAKAEGQGWVAVALAR